MGLTSALNTALNGLSLNETSIDVLGNNISNAGTNGFKASQVLFTTQLSRTLTVGSAPDAGGGGSGGTNPRQIGLGATTAAIVKDFTQGGITNSTSPSDLAIQGDGFFVLEGSSGRAYSRAGNFALNSQNLLVNATGSRLQGFTVDDAFELQTETPGDIEIRLGLDRVAQETSSAAITGALRTAAAATTGTLGSILTTSATFFDDATGSPPGTPPFSAITAGTFLTDLTTANDGTGTNVFSDTDTISFAATKGERQLEAQTLTVAAGVTTVQDLLGLIEGTLGLHTTADDPAIPNDNNGAGSPVGVTVTTGGAIQIVGNRGTVNDLTMSLGDLTVNGTDLAAMTFTKTQAANGESAVVDFAVFDSLGQPVGVKMSAVLESRNSSSTTYRFFFDSADDSRADIAIGTGLLVFDGSGDVDNSVNNNGTFALSIQRTDTAADTMQFTIDLTQISGIVATNDTSTLLLSTQDGSAPGTLATFVIDESGIINGVFDNGIIRTLGQVVLGRFPNSQGLVENGNGTYSEGVSSGPAQLVTPGNSGAGTIRSGAIELSNTDIGRNLVELIVASTNYRGNARVISSVQQLVDELLVLGR